MDWKHLLAYITGTVDQELLLRNEYLALLTRFGAFGSNKLILLRIKMAIAL